jgi:hypothetical protein
MQASGAISCSRLENCHLKLSSTVWKVKLSCDQLIQDCFEGEYGALVNGQNAKVHVHEGTGGTNKTLDMVLNLASRNLTKFFASKALTSGPFEITMHF